MNRIKTFLLGLLALIIALPLQAQTAELSLDSCVAMALRNNRELQSARLQVGQMQHTRKAYFANYLPDVKLSVIDIQSFAGTQSLDFNLLDIVPTQLTGALQQMLPTLSQAWAAVTGQPLPIEQFAGLDLNSSVPYRLGNVFNGGVQLTQPLYMGGKITAAYRMSQIGERMAQLGLQLSEDEVILSTHEAYSLLLQASQLQRVACSYDSLLSQLLSDVQSAERHGLRSHNDVLKVRVRKSEAELRIIQANNAIRLAQMNLSRIVGLPLDQTVSVAEVHVTCDSMAVALTPASPVSRPEYNLLDLKSQLAAQQVRLARSEALPQLALMAGYSYSHGIKVMDDYLLHRPSGMVALSLTVPIYHGGEVQHKVRAARLEYERTVLEQEDKVNLLMLEIQQAANLLQEAILEVEVTQRNAEQAADNLRSSRRAFDLGLEPVSDLLEAQTLWQQAYARQACAQCALIVSEVRYRKACGTL